MKPSYTTRDKQVTREIHKLFWRAAYAYKVPFWAGMLAHPPFFFFVNILVPLQTAYGLQAIINKRFNEVGHHALLVCIYALAGAFFYWLASWGINRTGVRGAGDLQHIVFKNYLSKDYDFYTNNYIGSLGTQAADLRENCDDYSMIFMVDVPKIVTITLFSLIVIAVNAPLLALVTAAAMAITLTTTIYISTYRLRYRRLVSQASSELSGVLGDALSHAPAVKSSSQEDYEQERIGPALERWRKHQLRSWDLAIPANALRYILLAVTTAILLLVSSHLYQINKISIAIIALVQLYVVRLLTVTLEIGDTIKRYEQIMSTAYQPVATFMEQATIVDPESPRSIPEGKGYEVTYRGVDYRYPESKKTTKAVKDFSLTVAPGEKIGLVGHSGGGKTTLTKLLMRFVDVSGGSILINGVDIRDVKQKDLRALLGYVPQEPVLFHRSIAENIIYSKPHASKETMNKAAQVAYVDEFVKDLPNGYDTMVGERGIKLSGGQRQRVAIARALLADAPILILDEATSALDSESEKYIQKALWELMEDRTAIVIAHRLSTIQRMDRIAVVDKGAIVQLGTHAELLKDKKGIYAKLWAHQSDGYIAGA